MGVLLASVIGLSLVVFFMITTFVRVRRKRSLSAAERYQRDMRAIRLTTFRHNMPRAAGQVGGRCGP